MPSLKDIRRRIGSVQKTQQITRAMRMVAGAKLRRAQDAITAARPYAERMRATLTEVAGAQRDAEHPLLEVRQPVSRLELVVVTSDRGLCGAFNANVLKHAQQLIDARERQGAEGVRILITPAGRKARDHFRRRRPRQLGDFYPQEGWVAYGQAVEIAGAAGRRYENAEVDEVRLVYSEFVSPLTQRPRDVRLLPVSTEPEESGQGREAAAQRGEAERSSRETEPAPYRFEPSAEVLLAALVPRAVEVAVHRALLENQAGEHAARMAAMESATRNTEEMIESLTLQFNRARQAAITKELVEIVSGAEAL